MSKCLCYTERNEALDFASAVSAVIVQGYDACSVCNP